MPVQTLNAEQRNFVNQTCRPMIERLIVIHAQLQAFVDEADNQQSPIAATADDLGDGDGSTPRADAPVLTGALLGQLRNFCANMSAEITPAVRASLIENSVRDVTTILRGV